VSTNAARDAGSTAMAANAGSGAAAPAVAASVPAVATESRVLSAGFLALSYREKVTRRRAWAGSAGRWSVRRAGCTAREE
jgi:hypothetical protein